MGDAPSKESAPHQESKTDWKDLTFDGSKEAVLLFTHANCSLVIAGYLNDILGCFGALGGPLVWIVCHPKIVKG